MAQKRTGGNIYSKPETASSGFRNSLSYYAPFPHCNPLVRRNVLSVIRSNSCKMTPKLGISYAIIGPGMRVGHVALGNRQTLQAATQQPTVTDAVVSE